MFEDIWYAKNKSTTYQPFDIKPVTSEIVESISAEDMATMHMASNAIRTCVNQKNVHALNDFYTQINKDQRCLYGLHLLAERENPSAALLLGLCKLYQKQATFQKVCLDPLLTIAHQDMTSLVHSLENQVAVPEKKNRVWNQLGNLIASTNALKSITECGAKYKYPEIYYVLGYLYMAVQNSYTNASNVCSPSMKSALDNFSVAIKAKKFPETLKQPIKRFGVLYYNLMADSASDKDLEHECLTKALQFDPQDLNTLVKIMLQTATSHAYKSSVQDIQKAHRFFLDHAHDSEFVNQYADVYAYLGLLYFRGSPENKICADMDKAEQYLYCVVSNVTDRTILAKTVSSLGTLLLYKKILLPGLNVAKPVDIDEISSYFVRATGLGDIRGKFGLGLLAYWTQNYQQTRDMLQSFMQEVDTTSTLYPVEYQLAAWCMATVHLLGLGLAPQLECAMQYLVQAGAFNLPSACASIYKRYYAHTPEAIKICIAQWAAGACLDGASNETCKALLAVMGRFLVCDSSSKLEGINYITHAANSGNSWACLYMGCLEESSLEHMPATLRVKYLSFISCTPENEPLFLRAQLELLTLAKKGSLEAQVAIIVNTSYQSNALDKWLAQLIECPLQANILYETMSYASRALPVLIARDYYEQINTYAKQGNPGAQLIMGNTLLANKEYAQAIEQLQRTLTAIRRNVSPCLNEFETYLSWVYGYYAIHLFEKHAGNIDKIESKTVAAVCAGMRLNNKGAAFAVGILLATKCIDESVVIKELNLKPKKRGLTIDLQAYGDVLIRNGIKNWAEFNQPEKDIAQYICTLFLPKLNGKGKDQEVMHMLHAFIKNTRKDTLVLVTNNDQPAQDSSSDYLHKKTITHNMLFNNAKSMIAMGDTTGYRLLEKLAIDNNLDAAQSLVIAYLLGSYDIEVVQVTTYCMSILAMKSQITAQNNSLASQVSNGFQELQNTIMECAQGHIDEECKRRALGLLEALKCCGYSLE
jgi:tetratricopeptide (TPR) repeat protein